MLDLSLVDTDKFSVQFWRQGTDLVEQGNSVSFNLKREAQEAVPTPPYITQYVNSLSSLHLQGLCKVNNRLYHCFCPCKQLSYSLICAAC